jgi:hypothetical protein
MPPADLMVAPGKFQRPPTVTDAAGKTVMRGSEALPWTLDTLDLGGDIRSRLIRLQDYVRTILGGDAPKPSK